MKQFIYLIVIILLLSSCKERGGYVIEGKLDGLQSSVLYFVTPLTKEEGIRVDTIQSDKDGKFSFRGHATEMIPVIIYMENGNVWTTLWAKDDDQMILSGDAYYPELITVKGGEVNDLLTDFKTMHKDLLKEKRELTDKSSVTEQSDSLSMTVATLSDIDRQLKEAAEEFIVRYPSSVASVVLLQDYLMDIANPQLIQEYLSKISGEATQNPLYKKLVDVNVRIQRTISGATAPDFTVLNTQNDTINLYSFQGKYFLLTFAASWCEACDKDNDALSDLRKKVNKDRLEILTIALDADSSSWKNIVKEKNLAWDHVIDSHGWNSKMVSLYNITEIPSNVLIDKQNIIVGRNLSTDSIAKIIEEIKN